MHRWRVVLSSHAMNLPRIIYPAIPLPARSNVGSRAFSTQEENTQNNDKSNSSPASNGTTDPDSMMQMRYGTRTLVLPTPLAHPLNTPLTPYISHSISQVQTKEAPYDGFSVLFLGTGSGGSISSLRNTCSTLLQLSGQAFLFDCGEGTQRQMGWSKAKSGFRRVNQIFITHLHADHILGLTSFILKLQTSHASVDRAEQFKREEHRNSKQPAQGRKRKLEKEQGTVHVYGPPGLYNFLAANFAITCSKLNHIQVIVHELMGGREERGPYRPREWNVQQGNRQNKQRRTRNVFTTPLETQFEIAHPNLIRREVYPHPITDVWNISKASHPTSNSQLKTYEISAAQVTHLPGIQTFGYMIQEPHPQVQIDPEKAKALGVSPSAKYRDWKIGKSVWNDDKTRMVAPEEVVSDTSDDDDLSPARRGLHQARKFVYIGDNCHVSEAMRSLSNNAHVLVHEATMKEGEELVAVQRGHASAVMAGKVAKDVGANLLILNHLSGRAYTQTDVNALVESAQNQIKGNGLVAAAYDLMEVYVPRTGYTFRLESTTTDEDDKPENRG